MEWTPQPLDPADVTVHRRGRGAPLVLLHCLGMEWRFWDVLEPLADRYELIAYSFPGHGDTPLPRGQYGAAELTAQLHALARREGLERFHLAGISMGGSVAQHFAGTHPEMVEKLILCDCTPRYNEEQQANWPVRAAAAREKGVASLIPTLLQTFFTPASLAENGRNVQYVRRTFEACSDEGYALACEMLAMVDARAEAARITAPTLIMLGSEERQPFKEAAAWMQATIAGSRVLEVPAAAHASVRERPEFVVQAWREFLE
ncbi:alpha/beta fold hydrolase [Siccirubricoccus sp. KC 17139]|uniref:Alpha/beta fold hydrolase n=1 Tax=Siccirubricoccus soli TaxID=2899147 RepID=A0ABT1DA71_9PROT|nr:alpha/beta fold hydrolase [Siccirubricoccus soli]MCO6418843.1 alpha/beta fold hydrolase [Siccirubricoccus soli]MCP2684978.1 alpha/beta fold hydrolase [Siccirubricoccus soli]